MRFDNIVVGFVVAIGYLASGDAAFAPTRPAVLSGKPISFARMTQTAAMEDTQTVAEVCLFLAFNAHGWVVFLSRNDDN